MVRACQSRYTIVPLEILLQFPIVSGKRSGLHCPFYITLFSGLGNRFHLFKNKGCPSGIDGLGAGGVAHSYSWGAERKTKIARNTGLMRWGESERQTRSQLRTECAVSLRRQEVWLWSAENQFIRNWPNEDGYCARRWPVLVQKLHSIYNCFRRLCTKNVLFSSKTIVFSETFQSNLRRTRKNNKKSEKVKHP